MRSLRSRFEFTCRVAAFALLGWLLGGSIVRTGGRAVVRLREPGDVAARLAEVTRAGDASLVHLEAPVAPDAWVVDWLAALAHAGSPVTWSGKPPAVAMSVGPIVDPRPTTRIAIAAPGGAIVRVRDDASEIDSLRVSAFGARIVAPNVFGRVTASIAAQTVSAPADDPAVVRRVLLVGRASWEGKFIAAALEERGWSVDARFGVAPGVQVSSSPTGGLDTSRFAAVIVLDSSAQTTARSLDQYVRSGGGLVLVGAAAAAPALTALAAGRVSARTRPNVRAADTIRLGTTGFYPVSKLEPGAVVLERGDGGVSIAARRIEAGRVVQVGYDDTWRWRMAGDASSQRAHREWWSRLVASVAYAPMRTHSAAATSLAPLAYLVGRLGPARATPSERHRPSDPRLALAAIMILLLMEWTSRRLRGLK